MMLVLIVFVAALIAAVWNLIAGNFGYAMWCFLAAFLVWMILVAIDNYQMKRFY